jgi:hydrogenase maturation protein HypF
MPGPAPRADRAARRLTLEGRVQGVGFRPFVFRLAHRLGLAGRVWNARGSVVAEVQGPAAALACFERDVVGAAPPLARPRLVRSEAIELAAPFAGFAIEHSDAGGAPRVFVPADQFACDDCLAELRDPRNRRFRYPFINCTQCGPRYTLIERLPYDRANTTMVAFALCGDCLREYQDPFDRRHHAEPTACPACGPALTLRPAAGGESLRGEAALRETVRRLQAGEIVAVKGVGGYHLLCDARDEAAVRRLRERKRRPHKPLAVMYPRRGADGLAALRADARPDALETAALLDPARPIVLVTKRADASLAPAVAPGLDEVGAFLPYSPLHELLLGDFGGPLVATSGNLSGEPVIIDPAMAEARLAHVADAFLHHDRPIARPADDPVLRRAAGAMRPLRLGRGTAPLELDLPDPLPVPTLATGAHLKNCVALAWERRVVVSPHVGSMASTRSLEVFAQVAADLQRLYGVEARAVVCDAHPGYATSRWARRSGLPLTRVAHHAAHASALAAEHGIGARGAMALADRPAIPPGGPLLVFCWDGLGLGEDGTLWGGETLLGRPGAWRRVASLRPFRLPGGDRAAVQPWRSAASLCWHAGLDAQAPDCGGPEGFADGELLRQAWARGLQSPWTSSAGRLFDAAAFLVLGIRDTSHEAQAPMQLEALAAAAPSPAAALPLDWRPDDAGLARLDWAPLLPMLADAARPATERAACFHESLAAAIESLAAARCAAPPGTTDAARPAAIGFAGGVFQNRRLLKACTARLGPLGLPLLLPQRLPANDAAICLGQAAEWAGAQGC